MKKYIIVFSILLVSCIIVYKSVTFPAAGFGDSTGAPLKKGVYSAYTGCNNPVCHSGNPINSPHGGVDIVTDIPSTGWVAGGSYRIRVIVAHPNRQMWGFQFMAWGAVDSMSVGSLVAEKALGDSARIIRAVRTVSGVVYPLEYATHSRNCIVTGAEGQNEYTFTWRAPSTRTQDVIFYATGMAANGNGGSSGDFVYLVAKNADSSGTAYRRDFSHIPANRFELVTSILKQLDASSTNLAKVFPTKTSYELFVTNIEKSYPFLHYYVFGIDGTQHASGTISASNSIASIPVSKLPNGMYLLKLQHAGDIQIVRFQKM